MNPCPLIFLLEITKKGFKFVKVINYLLNYLRRNVMSKEKHQEGVCPICGSSIDLGYFKPFSDDVNREWECRACEAFAVAIALGG